MNAQPSTVPTAENLQNWANDSEAAKANLSAIFRAMKTDESLTAWAVETLENCGIPSDCDLDFLVQSTTDVDGDVAYWACKLLGRMAIKANPAQEALCRVVTSHDFSMAAQQQAAHALGRIGKLSDASLNALRNAALSNDPRLAKLANQALDANA